MIFFVLFTTYYIREYAEKTLELVDKITVLFNLKEKYS